MAAQGNRRDVEVGRERYRHRRPRSDMAFKSTWTPPQRARDKPIPAEPPRLSGGFTYSASGGVAVPKAEKADPRGEQAHKDKLATLGCMVCRRLFPGIAPGPVVLHHF